MGFLTAGRPLSWNEAEDVRPEILYDGITQLLHIWNVNQYRHDTDLKWGDEIEVYLIQLDEGKKRAKLWAGADEILQKLVEKEAQDEWAPSSTVSRELGQCAAALTGSTKRYLLKSEWHPEFSNTVIEATPNPPYEMSLESLLDVEDSMISRRYKIQSLLPPGVFVASLAVFPRLGLRNFLATLPGDSEVDYERDLSAGSQFIPKQFITPHPRFKSLAENTVARRGTQCMDICIPIFNDAHTNDSTLFSDAVASRTTTVGNGVRKYCSTSTAVSDGEMNRREILTLAKAHGIMNPIYGQIYMDHFGFGMGQNCLQATFLAHSISSARYLYDQLSVISPLFLCLSASSPMHRGLLADVDTRWPVLEQGCDCRTESELKSLIKGRYASASLYISDDPYLTENLNSLNDVQVNFNREVFDRLVQAGMDGILAKHFAWLWTRDPLVIFGDRVTLDNKSVNDHFENINSTNWHSVRFKVPPAAPEGCQSPIGWRVEFRTPDIQMSDFENAALASLVCLLTMAILRKNWNFYIPMSKLDANFSVCHERAAISEGKFWFRHSVDYNSTRDDISQMTLREIFLGSRRTRFEGLVPLLDKFVSEEWRAHRCSSSAVEKYRRYADLVRQRVLGRTPTGASLLRQLARTHTDYQGDSVVSEMMNFTICKTAIQRGFIKSDAHILAPVRHRCLGRQDILSCIIGISRLHLRDLVDHHISAAIDDCRAQHHRTVCALPTKDGSSLEVVKRNIRTGSVDIRTKSDTDFEEEEEQFAVPPTGGPQMSAPAIATMDNIGEILRSSLLEDDYKGIHSTCRCPLKPFLSQTVPSIIPSLCRDVQPHSDVDANSSDWL